MARIAMVVSNRHDPDPRVHKEARSLAIAGHEVTIFAFDRMHELPVKETTEDGVRINRIRVRRSPLGDIPATAVGLHQFRAAVCGCLARLRPDVVHCHDQDTCSVGLWWKSHGARRAGVRHPLFIYDAHDLYWTWLLMADPDALWRRAGSATLRAQAMFFARAADLVITVTEGFGGRPGLAEVFRGWGVDPLVVWNAPFAVKSLPPFPRRHTLGYVGTIRETAMFEWLAGAMELLSPDERPAVLLAGGGVAAKQVEELMGDASRRLGFDLDVLGSFSLPGLFDIMAATSIQYCLYPTRRGNISMAMPVKLLDSVAHGRPVIGNAGTLMGEWIEANRWGWTVDEGAVDDLADVLAQFTRGGLDDLRFGQSAVPTWEREGARLVEAYDRFLN